MGKKVTTVRISKELHNILSEIYAKYMLHLKKKIEYEDIVRLCVFLLLKITEKLGEEYVYKLDITNPEKTREIVNQLLNDYVKSQKNFSE